MKRFKSALPVVLAMMTYQLWWTLTHLSELTLVW